jgi:1-phosphatidylinositol phosphodiesterase
MAAPLTGRVTASEGEPPEGAMNKFISHSSWMKDIPDDTPVISLSIPGTHNSCSVGGILGFTKTQDLDLSDQLDGGIRFLDIRLSHYEDNLFVHHDVVYMGKCYGDVLAVCLSFLEEHPSETILMSVKDEGRRDSVLGRLAPSRVFGRSRGDPMNWVIRSNSFEDAFKARTWEHVEDPSRFYNLAPPISGGILKNTNLTSKTTLGEVRGKIILLRRFEAGEDVGFDLTYWRDNTRFRSTAGLIYAVEDHWWDPGADDKYGFIITHMEEARRRDPKDLYITFSSAVNLKSRSYSETINPQLNDHLAGSLPGRTGIIAMDYFEAPRELVSNVIKMNATAGDRKSRLSYRRYPAPSRTGIGTADHSESAVNDLDMKLMKIAIEEARSSLSAGGVPVWGCISPWRYLIGESS